MPSGLHIDTAFSQYQELALAFDWRIKKALHEGDMSSWSHSNHEKKALDRHVRTVDLLNSYLPYPYDPNVFFLSRETTPDLWSIIEDAITHENAHILAIDEYGSTNPRRARERIASARTYANDVELFLKQVLKANREMRTSPVDIETSSHRLHILTSSHELKTIANALEGNIADAAKDRDVEAFKNWSYYASQFEKHVGALEFIDACIPHPYDPNTVFLSEETMPALWKDIADMPWHPGAEYKCFVKIALLKKMKEIDKLSDHEEFIAFHNDKIDVFLTHVQERNKAFENQSTTANFVRPR